ncbi:glycosyltransferase [Trinickia violacea]|uniref:Glycosyltransferase n=1 Tax=Trinickia violacea TaxID=2571746 RepID=A0A4P8J261_9BURK|nr:glycosyltransferase [Trinickia violacea]QCP54123.1 glycosyltransferase [Trinickia violacea]
MSADHVARHSVLYLASRPPFPARGGREKLILQSLDFLAAEHDVHVIVFCGRSESVDAGKLRELGCRSVTTIALPNSVEVAFNVVTRLRHSLQENLFFSRRAQTNVREIACQGFDVVVADMLRTAQYCDVLKLPKIVDLDDLLADRYRQFIENGHHSEIFGTFSNRIPRVFKAIEPMLRRHVLKREQRIIGNRERGAPSRFDATLLTSLKEVRRLETGSPAAKSVYANPQAVAVPNAVWHPDPSVPVVINLFFVGNLKTSQNLASLKHISHEIMPALIGRGLNAVLHTIGDHDQRAGEITAGIHRNVVHYGFVSDFSTILHQCHVALMPIVEGTGIKTKVLDAMAMGIPVVTNELGIEGLTVTHGREVLIAHSPNEAARLVEELANNPALCQQISLAARAYVVEHHDPLLLRRQFLEHVSVAVERGRERILLASGSGRRESGGVAPLQKIS